MKPGDPISVGVTVVQRDGHTYYFTWRIDRHRELNRILERFAADSDLNFTWEDAGRVAWKAQEYQEFDQMIKPLQDIIRPDGKAPPITPANEWRPQPREWPGPQGWLIWFMLMLVLAQGCLTRQDIIWLRQSVERRQSAEASEP